MTDTIQKCHICGEEACYACECCDKPMCGDHSDTLYSDVEVCRVCLPLDEEEAARAKAIANGEALICPNCEATFHGDTDCSQLTVTLDPDPMTRKEALAEARRRWGRGARVSEEFDTDISQADFIVGLYTLWGWGRPLIEGHGATWEEAFANVVDYRKGGKR